MKRDIILPYERSRGNIAILFDFFVSNNYPTNLLEIEHSRGVICLTKTQQLSKEINLIGKWFRIQSLNSQKKKKKRKISRRETTAKFPLDVFLVTPRTEHQSCYTACKNQGMHTKSCRKVGCYFVADVLALMKFMNSLPRGLVTRGGTFI